MKMKNLWLLVNFLIFTVWSWDIYGTGDAARSAASQEEAALIAIMKKNHQAAQNYEKQTASLYKPQSVKDYYTAMEKLFLDHRKIVEDAPNSTLWQLVTKSHQEDQRSVETSDCTLYPNQVETSVRKLVLECNWKKHNQALPKLPYFGIKATAKTLGGFTDEKLHAALVIALLGDLYGKDKLTILENGGRQFTTDEQAKLYYCTSLVYGRKCTEKACPEYINSCDQFLIKVNQ